MTEIGSADGDDWEQSREQRVAFDALLLLLLAAAAIAAAIDAPIARPALVTAAVFFVPGAAVLTLLPVRGRLAFVALALALSLAIDIAASMFLVWSDWWHPEALGWALASVAGLLLIYDAMRCFRHGGRLKRPGVIPGPGLRRSGAGGAHSASGVWSVIALMPLLVGLVAWVASLPDIPTSGLGVSGLAPALPLTWYGALVLLLGGSIVSSWSGRTSAAVTAAYIGSLVLLLYGTVPAIIDVPQYAWVYKHIGVTNFINVSGGVDPSIDIYNRWPGFFAGAAAYSRWVGLEPVQYAAFAEPFFALTQTLIIASISYTLVRDRRVAAFAAVLFAVGNWVGQSYFAPQAAAYTIGLGTLLVLTRCLLVSDIGQPWQALLDRVFRGPQRSLVTVRTGMWNKPVAVIVVLLMQGVVVITHQLTPYILDLQVLGLTLLGLVRPRWLVVAMSSLTVAYLVPNYDYVREQFGVFSSFDPARNVQSGDFTPHGLDFLHANAGGLLSVSLIAFMLIATVRLGRRGQARMALVLLTLAVMPFALLFGQNYGGEASLRVFLFSSPWRDVLIAFGIATLSPRWRIPVAAAVAGIVTFFFVLAFFGASGRNILPADEVTASKYFYANAPRGSVLLLAAPDFPTKLGATYAYMRGPQTDDGPNIAATPSFQDRTLGRKDIPAVIQLIRQYSSRGYVVFATTGYIYNNQFRLTPAGQLRNLERVIARSPQFRIWFGSRNARIYELVDSAPG